MYVETFMGQAEEAVQTTIVGNLHSPRSLQKWILKLAKSNEILSSLN